MRNLKKVIASFLVVAILATLGTTSVFAATQSIKRGDSVTIKNSGTYVVGKNTKATWWNMPKTQRKTAKTVIIAKAVKIKGKKLPVKAIASKAIKGSKKLKTIKVKANITYIHRNAFKGVTKAQLAKIKVKVKIGAMTKKHFNKFKKALIKKGFKAKNITWY